jgi:hypothetical protein
VAVQPARRGTAYAQSFVRRGHLHEPVDEPRILALADLAALGRPVVAPDGMTLAPGTPVVSGRAATAAVLLELFIRQEHPDATTLSPLYLEPPSATIPAAHPPTWPPSLKAS